MRLHNIYGRKDLLKKLESETFKRKTISFYRYVIFKAPKETRDSLYAIWAELGVLGRIYIAHEGINAQLSIPEHNQEAFFKHLDSLPELEKMPIKWAIEDDGKSFLKLTIKVKNKIVADGLTDNAFDVTKVGRHLSAREFNDAMEEEGTLVVDMRNHYESEIGHFENAFCPDVDTFREEIKVVEESLKDKKNHKILLYCTGGVRCEKASAYLKHKGFKDVNQLHGGIIDYARQIKAEGLESKFIGKNFVFDNRLGERVGNTIIARCHQCGAVCDTHTNCANDDCHLLFIQCPACAAKHKGCCGKECTETLSMTEDERKRQRTTNNHPEGRVFKSKIKPSEKFQNLDI